jgi:polar amino acid transport system substrate-binding protein
MKRYVLSLALALIAMSNAALAEKPLNLMANTSPPYADNTLPGGGLALELLDHVFSTAGIEHRVTIETWSRALEGARIGVYDGLATAWYSDERAQDLLFSEPYLTSQLIILQRRDNPNRYTSLQQLQGARLGVRADYAYGVDFAAVPGLALVAENHLIQNLLNLLNGRVDFVIGDRRTVNQQLHEYLGERRHELKVSAIELPSVARHVAISRSLEGHAELVSRFNTALAKALADGSHKAIVKRWDDKFSGSK